MNVPVFLDMVQKLRNVVMKDAPLGTGQRKPIRLAAMMDVPTLLWGEGVVGMVQEERSAILKDVPTTLSMEEFALDMMQRGIVANMKNALTMQRKEEFAI